MMAQSSDFDMPDPLRLEPSLRPYVDTTTFRNAMAAMGATASFVTTQLGAERLGRTVTSVFSLSVEPPAILVSIDMSSRLADHIVKTGGFSLALLAQGQEAIADAFAGRSDPERRFETGRWMTWKSGHPRLVGSVASMDCAVLGAVETGSHVLFVGGVIDIDLVAERSPLIWHQRQYKRLSEDTPNLADVLSLAGARKKEEGQ